MIVVVPLCHVIDHVCLNERARELVMVLLKWFPVPRDPTLLMLSVALERVGPGFVELAPLQPSGKT